MTPLVSEKRTNKIVGKQNGESREQVRRYIRLTFLIPEILDMVDEKKNVKKETKIEQKQEEPKVQETETKTEEKTPTTPTKSDLSYWCAEGGKHHVAGDRANEHGYYNTWDDAYTAFENYTKGWASVQYKISQCACGKFYFWAIQ